MSLIERAIEKVGDKGVEDKISGSSSPMSEIKRGDQGNDSSVTVSPVDSAIEIKKKKLPRVKKPSNTKVKSIKIDQEKLAEMGFLNSKDINTQLVEEYRVIKRPLVNNALEAHSNGIDRANLILVTSSQPGEGKTYNAINLALSIASERDKKVLLIDADVAKPSISKLLGIDKNSHGLMDYLDGEELDFSMMMLKTDIPGLSIIPAGKRHGYSTELLASQRMAVLVDELHSRYPDRIVIFDSPPLLAATQAEVLAGLVGQVVFIVEAENTLQNVVLQAIEKLKVCDVVLAVLNKSVNSFSQEYGYGLYGQYGH